MRRRWPGYLAAFLVFALFAGIAVLPWKAKLVKIPSWQATSAVARTHISQLSPAVAPTSVPTADNPTGPRATQPNVDATHEAELVRSEDQRIRRLLHGYARLLAPTLKQYKGAAPTLVLPARPAVYTADDLYAAHALTELPGGGGTLLVDSILIAPGAVLSLGGASMTVLRMTSTATTFTSIVVSGGTLKLAGAAADVPMTITSWNPAKGQIVPDTGGGRSYIRAIGSRMDLRFVHISALGFWSGRTGGVAWTGSNNQPSAGGADSSSFTGDIYGAFVSNTTKTVFTNDLFQSNEADGIRLHRNTIGATVSGSTAARNGANGFVVDRGATSNTLSGDVSLNNSVNGFLLDGRPLVKGASPSGAKTSASVGTVLKGSDAENNGHTGILVEGGQATSLLSNVVCSSTIAIALRDSASGSIVDGNNVRCGGLVALSIGPAVTSTTAEGNILANAHIGILVRASPGVRLINNQMNSTSIFGISIRGASPDVEGTGNSVTGLGVRSLDVKLGAPQPVITNTDVSNWSHRAHVNTARYFRYHPILMLWGVIIALVLLSSGFARLRRGPKRLYAHTGAPVPDPLTPSAGTVLVPALNGSEAHAESVV